MTRSTLLLTALLAAGCAPEAARCRPGTLLIAVTLDATSAQADTLAVTLSLDGVAGTPSRLPHTTGSMRGNIEVDFPHRYPRGAALGIDVQALLTGTPIGDGRATQPLVADCEVKPLAVTALAAGDLGGDLGDLLAPPPADLTPPLVDQAMPADLFVAPDMTCVPVTEGGDNCFDGIDNDCDGLIDCADTADCSNAQCVPPVTSGFALGIAVAQISLCPGLFTSRSLLDSGLGAAACPSTSCSCTGVQSCSIDFESDPQAMCSGEAQDFSASSSCRSLNPDNPTVGISTMGLSNGGGSCSPSGTSAVPSAGFSTLDRFCATAARGGGCSGGQLCIPKLAVQTCEVADGSVACDSGYTASGGPWFTGYDDNRSCQCECGAANNNGSCGTSVAFYGGVGNTTCSGTPAATVSVNTMSCSPAGAPYHSMKISGGAAPTCGAATALEAGTLAGSGPQTLCCLP